MEANPQRRKAISDGVINFFEIKFSTKLFVIDKRYSKVLEHKMRAFKENISSRTTVFFIFITTFGVADNDYRQQFVDSEIKMEAQFD